ncbi:MAG: ABC transporter permease [Alphaproteobacteria bacterium]
MRRAGVGRRGSWLILAPALAVLIGLLAVPLVNVAEESFRLFVPGRVGAAEDAPLTLVNYAELLQPAYLRYFADTFRISLIAALLALAIGYPLAYYLGRQARPRARRIWITALVALVFLSILVRVYAVALAFGPSGFGNEVAALLGLAPSSRDYAEALIVAGLMHCLVPMAALSLIATVQNINPRLFDAALALGAARIKAHLTVTLPLSVRGLLGAFMLCYTFSISAFVIPMVLGKGRVLFVSNLIYSRFGEVGDYPGGAAISLVMLVLSILLVYVVTRAAGARWEKA